MTHRILICIVHWHFRCNLLVCYTLYYYNKKVDMNCLILLFYNRLSSSFDNIADIKVWIFRSTWDPKSFGLINADINTSLLTCLFSPLNFMVFVLDFSLGTYYSLFLTLLFYWLFSNVCIYSVCTLNWNWEDWTIIII